MSAAKNSKGKPKGSRKPDSKSSASSKTSVPIRGSAKGEKPSYISDDKLRFIFEAIGDGITIIDLSGTIVEVNQAAVRIGGHKTREDLIGRNGLEFIKPEERDMAARETMKALGQGSTAEMVEYTMVMADGSEKNVQVSVAPLRDSSGNLEGVITVTRDISERRVMEAELQKAAKKLRLIIESIGDMLFITDMDLNIVNANEAAVRTLGYASEQELLGRGVTDMVAEKDSARVVVQLGKVLADERSGGVIEYTIVNRSGQEFDVEATVEILRDCAAKVVGLIITARDVTERKRMQEAVRLSEEKMRTMFGTITDGIVVIDMEGRIVDMNEAAYRLAGYSSREEIIGINTLDFIAEEDRERVANDMMGSFTQGTVARDLVYKLKRKDGTKFDVEFSASMLKDAEGNPVGFIAVERDVTERRRMEAELEKSAEKLRIVIESIGDMLFITDLDLNLNNVNDAAVRLLGYGDKARLLGRSIIEHVAVKDSTRVAMDMGRALAEKKGIEILQYTMVSADGREFEIEANTEVLRDCAGKVIGLIVTARDITERKRMEEAVRASEEKLRIMFHSMHDAVILTDMLGTIIEANEASEKITGYSRDELIGRNGMDLISPEYHQLAAEVMAKVLEEGLESGALELKFTTADGRQLDAEFSTAVLRDGSGNPVGFVSIARDITERKRMEEELRDTAEKLRAIFDAMGDGISVADKNANIVDVNEAVLSMGGFAGKEELIGRSGFDLISPADRDRIIEDTMKALTEGRRTERMEYAFVPKVGRPFDVELQLTMLKDEDGNPRGYVGVTRDISERKKWEKALKESEEELRAMFDSVRDGIIVVDMLGNMQRMNDAALRMTGYTREELIGKSAMDFVHPDDLDKVVADMGKTLESNQLIDAALCYRLVRKDGSIFEAEMGTGILRDAEGNIKGLVGVMRDITERKRMQEELQASEEKLRFTFQSIKDMLIVTDLETRVIDVNETTLQLTGYSREELLGRGGFDLISPKDRDRAIAPMGEALQTGRPLERIELAVITADGGELETEFSINMVHNAEGNPTGFIAVARDISERIRYERALKESEEKLRIMFESMRDAVILTDLNGKIIEVNNAAVKMHGYADREKMLGRNGLDLVAERDRKGVVDRAMQQSRGESPGDITEIHVLLRADGTEFESESSRTVLRDAAGKPMGFIAVERDISERKRMEQALIESESRFRSLFENMNSGVAVYEAIKGGEDFVFKDFNSAAERIGNIKKEELIGKSILEAYPNIKEYGLFDVLQRVWQTGESESLRDWYYQDERRSGWRDNYIYKLASGEVVAVYDDITERKQAEEDLRRSEEKLRAMFESTSDGLIVTDSRLTVVDANEAAARIFGYKNKQEIIGRPGLEFMETERKGDGDGKTSDVELSVSQLRDHAGNLAGFISIARDVTVRKRMEANLKRTVKDLERANRDMQQFVYVASHDLQEPLRMISSYTQLLARRYKGKMDTDADDFITYAVNGANLLQERIQALATYSRVNTRGKPFIQADMERALGNVVESLASAIESAAAVVTHDPLPVVTADVTQMEQLLQCLLDNAIKFRSDAPPQIHVSAEEHETEWVFSVSDNGIGIDPEFKDRIFVIFQRLHGGQFLGTGIGLPVCKRIMERHGGDIWMESETGKGATFYFSIPKKVEVEEASEAAIAETAENAGEEAAG